MIYRFRVLSTSTNADPTAFACDSAFGVMSLADYGLYVELNGEVMFDIAIGILNSTSHTVAPIDVGDLTFDFHVENLVFIKFDITGLGLKDVATLRIKITADDYDTYDNTIEIYGFDMGNNPNITYPNGMATYTKPINLKMIPKNWELPSPNVYHKVCASALVYRDFDEKRIHIMQDNSSQGTIEYFKTGAPNSFAGGEYVSLADVNQDIEKLDMVIEGFNQSSEIELQIPDSPVTTPVLSYTVGPNGCMEPNGNIIFSANFENVETYLLDDEAVQLTYTTIYISFDLIDAVTGLSVDHYEYEGTVDDNLWSDAFGFVPSLPFDRQYKFSLTIRNLDETGEILAQALWVLNPCAFEELTKTDCGTYTWQNKGDTANLYLKKVTAVGVFEDVQEWLSVEIGTTITVNLSDGVYVLEVERADVVVYTYPLISLCTFINCTTKYTKELACTDPCDNNKAGCGCNDVLTNSIFFTNSTT